MSKTKRVVIKKVAQTNDGNWLILMSDGSHAVSDRKFNPGQSVSIKDGKVL